MAQTNNTGKTNEKPFSHLFDNNWFVLAFSLFIAVILWCGVSMFQTTEVEKEFVNIKVQLNYEGSLPANNNMRIFGDPDAYIDVTVKGKSYLVNDESFADNINATVSFASVTTAGTYALPVSVSVSNADVEVVKYSKSTVTVYLDEYVEKAFTVTDEIRETERYSLPEGYTRENPRLSAGSVVVQGPALEVGKISEVKAVVELDKELTATETFTAEIVYVSTSENAKFDHVTLKNTDPIYITIPVNYTATFKPVVTFTNMPKDYREEGISYTVYPSSVALTLATGDNQNVPSSDEINIGTVDFSQIDQTKNIIRIPVEELEYPISEDITQFTVTVDMSSMMKRWLQVEVSAEDVKLPANAKIITETVMSVQVIGPAGSLEGIDNSEAYAVPQLEGVELKKGVNEVPAKIVLRTLTDCWVRGEYTVEIRVD
ncbi:MAG: hypothetical protein IK108_07020 [Clostridia bacterium]|nr:hypothetical protein [Clostridia bacterium]